MMTLVLDETHAYENDQVIPDFPVFLKNLPAKTGITLVLKTHDVSCHLCPIRKTVPYLKSAEFPADDWVGERRFPKGQTLVAGIAPSPAMRDMVHLLADHSFAIKGAFLWTDLVTQAYAPLPLGWAMILHDQHLMVCHDGILRVSRLCHLPFPEELPAILRYIKRFGYQAETPVTLLKASLLATGLPPFVHQEVRVPRHFSPEGFALHIPELAPLRRLYAWPRKICQTAYAITCLCALGSFYLGWAISVALETKHALGRQISGIPTKDPLDERKMEAFAAYCQFSKDKLNPLSLLRQIVPFIKEEAVATHLHWTGNPLTLTLHLEFTPSTKVERILVGLRSQCQGYLLNWRTEESEPLKGILTIEKK